MNVLLHLPDQLGQRLTELQDYNSFAVKALQNALEEQAQLAHYQQKKIQNGIQAAKAGQFADDKDVEAFFNKWR